MKGNKTTFILRNLDNNCSKKKVWVHSFELIGQNFTLWTTKVQLAT